MPTIDLKGFLKYILFFHMKLVLIMFQIYFFKYINIVKIFQ
jgi:hypothetical protein